MPLAQAQAFMDRRIKGNMAKFIVFLNGERGGRWDVSTKYQASLDKILLSPIIK